MIINFLIALLYFSNVNAVTKSSINNDMAGNSNIQIEKKPGFFKRSINKGESFIKDIGKAIKNFFSTYYKELPPNTEVKQYDWKKTDYDRGIEFYSPDLKLKIILEKKGLGPDPTILIEDSKRKKLYRLEKNIFKEYFNGGKLDNDNIISNNDSETEPKKKEKLSLEDKEDLNSLGEKIKGFVSETYKKTDKINKGNR